MGETVSVFVVDDHRLFLAGVEAELAEHVEVVGTATDVDDASAAILRSKPDVTLVDVHMPGGGGATVVRNVLERDPDRKFLALSASDAPDDASCSDGLYCNGTESCNEAVDTCGATLLHIHLHRFGEGAGVSGVAVLAESHISVHTWPERGFAAFDIFMCGSCDPEKAVPVLKRYFKPETVRIDHYRRGIVG